MPMLEPRELEQRRQHRVKKQKRKHRSSGMLPLALTIIAMYMIAVAIVPLKPLHAQTMPLDVTAKQAGELAWPAYGQAALGAVGYGILTEHGDPKPLPIASVAKVLTALAVLKERPIYSGQPMPTITLTSADVATYKDYAAQGQSVVAVEAGEQISEYQALQALLLPSANNMADVMVNWAFGSVDNYLKFANPFAKTIGMTNTTIADASGFLPATVSTATDLTKLAEIAMNNPILAEIVSQPQADIPVAGTVFNVNKLVGRAGFVGIKTGNTDQAGGCYMFSVRRAIDGDHQITLVGTIMGADNLSLAIDDAMPLIDSAFKLFRPTEIIHNSQIVGKINQVHGAEVSVVTKQNLSIVTWNNQIPKLNVSMNTLGSNVKQGNEVGHIDVKSADMAYSVPLVAGDSIKPSSYFWRLQHAAGYL